MSSGYATIIIVNAYYTVCATKLHVTDQNKKKHEM